MKFEFFQYLMNTELRRDELLAIFVVSFSVFLISTYWKLRLEETRKIEADANEKDAKEETDKTYEEER